MPFVNGIWIEPVKQDLEKQKISPAQINMQLSHSSITASGYTLFYLISINPTTMTIQNLTNANVDFNSLRESLISKLDYFDRPYLKLKNFSLTRATFVFDEKKWLNDALNNVNPNNRLSKFEQVFKFKKQPPKAISFTSGRIGFDKYILKKFDEYMEKNRKTRTWFEKFLPRDITGKIRLKISTMFDYTYDFQQNAVIAKLKPVYVMGILFATGATVSKIATDKKLANIKFEKTVKRRARAFNRNKWTKFIRQKR